jgi:cupin fold WbuC family metalloprotein
MPWPSEVPIVQTRRVNDEVYVADEPIVKVTRRDVEWLKGLAGGTKRRRVRLCAHKEAKNTLHEMLIVLNGTTYVRPHKHRGKSESFHVVEGVLSVVVFTEEGQVREVIRLGEYASGRQFYYRLEEPAFHTVLIESASAVIHETTNGPFDRKETEFAPWAPAEEDAEAGRRYLKQLAEALKP